MAKKRTLKPKTVHEESTVPPILHIDFEDPLFAAAAHPTRPVIITGLATGHLYCHSYDADSLERKVAEKKDFYNKKFGNKTNISSLADKWWLQLDHTSSVDTLSLNWKTKRHKGSCRSVLFDVLENSVGEFIYSGGTDNIIKKGSTETGKVVGKCDASSQFETPKDSITTMAVSTTHPFLLAGTDDGQVLVYDSKQLQNNLLKFKLPGVHDDSVNKILPMSAVSPYHYLSLGSTTLSHLDIRKGVLTQSDNQEDELLSMCYPTEFVNRAKNDTVLVSHGEGIITLWRESTNRLSDQILRIKVNKGASIDAMVSTMNAGDEEMSDCVWCGDSEGLLHRVNYKKSKIVETRVHSATTGKLGGLDEVGGLDIDYEYRLMSSGMEGLKIWSSGPGSDNEASETTEASDSEDDQWSDTEEEDSFPESEDEHISGSEENDEEKDHTSASSSGEVKAADTSQSSEVSRSTTGLQKKRRLIPNAGSSISAQTDSDESPKLQSKQSKKKKSNNGIVKFDGI